MAARRRHHQGLLRKTFGCVIALLTIFLLSWNLAGGDTPALSLHPLAQPGTLVPASEPLEVDPDPRATVLAQRLRQHLAGLQVAAPYTPPPQLTAEQRQALSELETRCPGEVSVSLRPLAGTPRQIKGTMLQQAQHGISAVGDAQLTTARTFLRTNCDLLRLDDPNAELVLVRRQTDKLDRTHLRFRQQYQGVPVWPADIIVHLNPEGHVDVMNGAFVPTPKNLSTTPTLDEATAVEYARTGLTDGDKAEVTASELIIYAPGDTPPRLAWKLELAIGLAAQWVVVIDAENGDELTAYNQVMHQAHWEECMVFDDPPRPHRFSVRNDDNVVDLFGVPRPLNIWRQDSFRWMIDTSKGMFDPKAQGWHGWMQRGAIWVRDAQNQEILTDAPVVCQTDPAKVNPPPWDPPYSWLPDAVSASYNLSQVYDYYRERHQRNSFDGQGASIHAIVRYGENYKNAFWLPGSNLVVFGDGRPFAGALDIVGHELTHGVIEHSANLLYQDQPGALNEAFADIFGEMVEAHTTGREPDWITGRDLGLPASGGGGPDLGRPIRNMKDPNAFLTHLGRPYPKNMREFFHIRENNGGIHINNTIITHAFYQLVKGLEGFYGSVEGIEALRDLSVIGCPASQGTLRNARQSWRHAMCDAERIFYRALTVHLVQNSQFIEARLACELAARELFGEGSIQERKTAGAFGVVGIEDDDTTPNPSRPAVRGPDATLFVYRDVLGQFRLGRREAGDGDQGVQLAEDIVLRARPSVSRGGGLAVFVNAENDFCRIATDGNGEECIELSIGGTIHDTVASAALSPDGRFLAVVFPDDLDTPADTISVINLATNLARTFQISAFSYTGPTPDPLPSASTMNFTADGQWLIYDALDADAVTVSGDEDSLIQRGQWSLYALDLRTLRSFPLIPPRRGFHIAFPALGQTNDNFLTFDMFDETRNQSKVYIAPIYDGKLMTEEMEAIATVQGGFGVPGFTGDDKALVFSQYDPNVSTGFSLCKQPLKREEGLLTPGDRVLCAGLEEDADKVKKGELSEDDWHLENAEMGVIYRRRLSRPGLTGRLESPSHGSLQSGGGQFSGWVCVTGPGGEPAPPAVPEVAERYFYDALEHRESSVDNRGNWWARTGSTNGTHITGRTTVQEVVDQVRRFTISYADDGGYDRTEFYDTILGAGGIFTIDIGNVRLSWTITGLSKSTLPPDPRSPEGTVIPPRITIDVEPGATVRNQDGSPWKPVPLTQTMDELGRDMYVVNILEDYIPGRLAVSSVEIEINDTTRIPAAYGTERRDTTSVCGDSNNGFVLPFNWNLLGEGTHTVRAIADGVEFDSATFTVGPPDSQSR